MPQVSNVEYFYIKCNQALGTKYTFADWGDEDNAKKAINVDWLVQATNKVYKDIHKPKEKTAANNYGCSLLLSSKLKGKAFRIAVDKGLVDKVVNYLINLNKPCDNDCACYKDMNCACDCTTACATVCTTCSGTCKSSGGACACTCAACACNCTCPNCACECGSNSECVCDCQPFDCNCSQALNCSAGSSKPKASNCVFQGGNCECLYTPPTCTCTCTCTCDPPGGGAVATGQCTCLWACPIYKTSEVKKTCTNCVTCTTCDTCYMCTTCYGAATCKASTVKSNIVSKVTQTCPTIKDEHCTGNCVCACACTCAPKNCCQNCNCQCDCKNECACNIIKFPPSGKTCITSECVCVCPCVCKCVKECDCVCPVNARTNCTVACACACDCGGNLGKTIIGKTCTTECNRNLSTNCVPRQPQTTCACHCQCKYNYETYLYYYYYYKNEPRDK